MKRCLRLYTPTNEDSSVNKYSDKHKGQPSCSDSECPNPGTVLRIGEFGLGWYCPEHDKSPGAFIQR